MILVTNKSTCFRKGIRYVFIRAPSCAKIRTIQRRTLSTTSLTRNKQDLTHRSGTGANHDESLNTPESKVTADELSSALKHRLRLNRDDISNVTHDEVDISQYKYKPSKIDLEVSSVPKDAIEYLNNTRKPKDKFIQTRYTISDDLEQVQPIDKMNLPQLAHGLEKVLSTRGIQYGESLSSKSRKKDAGKHVIDHLHDFKDLKSELIGKFVSPSKDKTLLSLSKETGSKYYSSTSSMTSTLFQFYLFMNNFDIESPNPERFKFGNFTRLMRSIPSVIIVSEKDDGISSIEVDKSCDYDTFLSKFGHIAEIVLTNEKDDMELYKKMYNHESSIGDAEEMPYMYEELLKFNKFKNPENIYNISTYDNILMRSQLDCYSPILKGSGTFDLKSRAISDIRFDTSNVDMENTPYPHEFSYTNEMQDLIRTGALLKYSFQARIGQMSGIFLAFHNIRKFLGYEYLPLQKIDKVFYNDSPHSSFMADKRFKFSLKMWRLLMDTIKDDLQTKNFRVILRSERKPLTNFSVLKVHAVPMSDTDLDQLNDMQVDFKEKLNKLTEQFLNKAIDDKALQAGRETVLNEYRTILNAFNESFADKITSYTMECRDYFKGEKADRFQLMDPSGKWTMSSLIVREEPDPNAYRAYLNRMVRLSTTVHSDNGRPKGRRGSSHSTSESESTPKQPTKVTEAKTNGTPDADKPNGFLDRNRALLKSFAMAPRKNRKQPFKEKNV